MSSRHPPSRGSSSTSSRRPHPSSSSSSSSSSSQRKKDGGVLAAAIKSAPPEADRIRKQSEFLCLTKFNTHLPDFPFEPKHLAFPYPENRFIKYRTTSLEKSWKRPIYTTPTLGINLNMVDPDVYATSSHSRHAAKLDEVDEEIVRDTGSTTRVRNQFRPDVPWLRKAEYFTSTVEQTFGFTPLQSAPQTIEPATKDELILPEERVRRINRSFDVPTTFTHPNRKELPVTDVLPLFPAFAMSFNANHRMAFDPDPLEEKKEHADKGLLETMTTEDTHQKLAVLSVPEGDAIPVTEDDDEDEGTESNTYYKKDSTFHYELKEFEEGGQIEEFVLVVEKNACSYLSLEGMGTLKRKRGDNPSGRLLKKKKKVEIDKQELLKRYLRSLDDGDDEGEGEEGEEEALAAMQDEEEDD